MPLGSFSGLNNQDNSLIIPNSNAQDLLNVDITPGGRSVKKRHGYGLDATLTISTSAVHNGYHFFDASGNDIRLWMNDVNVSASVNSGAYTTIVTSATKNSTMTCADSQGFAWCVDSNNDQVFRTNGAAVTFFSNHPQGTLITASPTRLVIGNVTGNVNTLYFSASGDYTNETVGSQTASPFQESILSPGSHLTHIRYWNGRYLFWKDQSFGYVIGDDQFSANIVMVSNLVGTYDNASVENEGIIYFRGQDNHIWAYDGGNLVRLTREITPLALGANKKKTNSWTQATASDFNSGSFTTTTYNASFSGVIISTNNVNIPNNSFESAGSWTTIDPLGGWSLKTNNISTDHCAGGIAPADGSFYAYYTANTQQSFTISLIDAISASSYGSLNTSWSDSSGCSMSQLTLSSSSITAPLKTQVQVQISIPGTGTGIATSASFAYSGNSITFYSITAKCLVTPCYFFDFFQNGQTNINGSGIYYSAVNNAPNLTTWGVFTANTQNNSGTHSFFVRSSTNSFTVTSSTPAWVAQTVGATVAASTGTYMQMSDTFTVTASSQNPVLSQFIFNWNEGAASDQSYGTYFDFAILWAISYGASATTNNRILRYDLINQTWTVYDIAANGFLVQNNLLYFGDPVNGKVYVFANGNESDNGAAINAYWKSKDFTNYGPNIFQGYNGLDIPFNTKEFRTLSTMVAAQTVGTLNITYTLDRLTASTYSMNMFDAMGLLTIRHNYQLPSGTNGNSISLQYGNNAANQAFELLGAQLTYMPKQWNVYSP